MQEVYWIRKKAGFNKVVFIIRKDIENEFKELIKNTSYCNYRI